MDKKKKNQKKSKNQNQNQKENENQNQNQNENQNAKQNENQNAKQNENQNAKQNENQNENNRPRIVPCFPNEILCTIFRYLSDEDLSVIKEADDLLGEVVDYIGPIRSVWVKGNQLYKTPNIYKLFYTRKVLTPENCYVIASPKGFMANDQLATRVRKLVAPVEFFFEYCLKWIALIQLEITEGQSFKHGVMILKAPNLKMISFMSLPSCDVEFRTPMLRYFKVCNDRNNLCHFSIPKCITYLETRYIPDQIRSLSNLEHVRCWEYNAEKVLLYLPYLKKFSFHRINGTALRPAKRFLQILCKRGIRLYYAGILYRPHIMTNHELEMINDYYCYPKFLVVYIRYLPLVEDDLPIEWLDMNNLDDLPLELIRKLCNIQSIFLKKPFKKMENWTEFLKMPNLRRITLLSKLINQKFLDLIPDYATNLTELILRKRPASVEFVKRLKELRYFSCLHYFDFRIFKEIVESCTHLNQIEIDDDYMQLQIMVINGKVSAECVRNEKTKVFFWNSLSEFRKTVSSMDRWRTLFKFVKKSSERYIYRP